MDNRAGTPVNELFNGLGISIYTTWLIATTADYPDQMLPSYTYARSAGIFFFVYILITVFLFVELILAVVYEGYLAYLKTRLITGNEARVAGLKAAFALIADSDGKISRASFEALVKETNRVDKIPKVSALETDYFFDILDDDRSGSISKEEFFDVCDILQYSFKKVSTTTWCERHRSQFAAGPFYSSVKRFVASPALAVTTSTLLVVNAVVVFAESYYDLTNTLTPSGEERFAMAECVFSLLYMGLLLAELLVKLLAAQSAAATLCWPHSSAEIKRRRDSSTASRKKKLFNFSRYEIILGVHQLYFESILSRSTRAFQ